MTFLAIETSCDETSVAIFTEDLSILANVVTISGRVRGAWRRTSAQGRVRLEVRGLDRFGTREATAVGAAGRRMGRFLERPVELVWL